MLRVGDTNPNAEHEVGALSIAEQKSRRELRSARDVLDVPREGRVDSIHLDARARPDADRAHSAFRNEGVPGATTSPTDT